MILVTTETIAGKQLEMLGLVKGSTIQSKNIGHDISQSFKTLVGGELKAYTDMMNTARALATKRMVEEAEQLGADAIVCVRYASASVMQGGRRSDGVWHGREIHLSRSQKQGNPAAGFPVFYALQPVLSGRFS